jgi:hypothetical protein
MLVHARYTKLNVTLPFVVAGCQQSCKERSKNRARPKQACFLIQETVDFMFCKLEVAQRFDQLPSDHCKPSNRYSTPNKSRFIGLVRRAVHARLTELLGMLGIISRIYLNEAKPVPNGDQRDSPDHRVQSRHIRIAIDSWY